MSPEAILLSLLQGDGGTAWANRRQGWKPNSNEPVCLWYGVICDTTDKKTVTGLFLPQSGLSGSLPSELGWLKTLRSITLSQNLLYGTIPQAVANLPVLEVLNLADNKLTGTIPHFVSGYLHSLILGYNLLSGTIPESVAQSNVAMMEYDVMHNLLTGTIPHAFSQLEKLTELSLSNNTLSGTIPGSLGEIKVLQYLYLDHNYLVGFIPPSLSRLGSALEEIWLQQNLLSGTLPAALADLTKLVNLYIDGNKFTGTVPKDLCSSKLNADFFLDLDSSAPRDECDSIACPMGHVAEEGVYPCKPCDDRFFNPYLGRVGQCINMNQRDILKLFYKATGGGRHWNHDENWNIEDSFLCTFYGVTCDNNNHVISIKLPGMGLKGTIPEEIGFLRYLQELDLSDNELEGYLPSDLRFAPLEKLDVSNNKLQGMVPPTLCLKENINGNGYNNDFNCDDIACPVGTYSSLGYRGHGVRCVPCHGGATFLASTTCYGRAAVDDGSLSTGGRVVLSMFLLGSLILLPLCLVKFGQQKVRRALGFGMDDIPEDDDDRDMIEDLCQTVNTHHQSGGVTMKEYQAAPKRVRVNGDMEDALIPPDDDYNYPSAAMENGDDDYSHGSHSTQGSISSVNSRGSSRESSRGSSQSSKKSLSTRSLTKSSSLNTNHQQLSLRRIHSDDKDHAAKYTFNEGGSKRMLYLGNGMEMEMEPERKSPGEEVTETRQFSKEQSEKEIWLDVPAI